MTWKLCQQLLFKHKSCLTVTSTQNGPMPHKQKTWFELNFMTPH